MPSTAVPARTITQSELNNVFLTDARVISNEKICAVIVDLTIQERELTPENWHY